MSAYQTLVLVHIGAGSIALLAFWLAALLRKGSTWHRRVGRIYLLAMLAILATSLPMAMVFLVRGRIGIGVFFAYLVVITGTAMWLSWRAIQYKRAISAYFDQRYRWVGLLNVLAGLAVFGVGLWRGSMLLSTFCWVGVAIGISMLRKHRSPPDAANWWLREHYGAMLGNGVATHVAFLGIAMRDVLTGFGIPALQMLPWFLPLAVAGIAAVVLDRRHRPRRAVAAAA